MTTYAPLYYTGDGSQTDYAASFTYLQKSHVKVTLDGTASTAFTWVNASTIRFTTAPANGVRIKVYRDTSAALVTWNDGATILGRDLNLASNISRYIAEEAVAENLGTLGLNLAQTAWDAEEKRIVDVADPSAAQDVATKNYVDTGVASGVALAEAAQAAAEAAQAAAEASEDAVAASASTASTAASTATTAAATATTQASTATTAAATATTQASAAATARTAAETAEANAETALAATETARDLAEGYKDAAAASAGSAAASVAAAATAYDNFDDRYLGQLASDPTLDNDGNALTVGALYFNTVLNKMKAWTGASWSLMYNDTATASAVTNDSAAAGATVADALTGLNTAVSGKAATSHTHAIADTTGLQTALDGKAATSHIHAIADTTGLQTALDAKAPLAAPALTGAATLAGSAILSLGNFGTNFPQLDASDTGSVTYFTDFNTLVTTGFHRIYAAAANGPGAGYEWGLAIVNRRNDVITQLAFDHPGTMMAFRSASGIGATPSWGAWRTVVHDGNVATYAPSEWVEISDVTIGSAVATHEVTWTAGAYCKIELIFSNLSPSATGSLSITLRDTGSTDRVTFTHGGSINASDTLTGNVQFTIGLDGATKFSFGLPYVTGATTGAIFTYATAATTSTHTLDIDRVRLSFSGGNIDAGRIIVKGLKA